MEASVNLSDPIGSEISEDSLRYDLEKARRRAKDLLRAVKSGDSASISFVQKHAHGLSPQRLTVCQLALARSLNFSSWADLRKKCEAQAAEELFELVAAGDVQRVSAILKEFPKLATVQRDEDGSLLHAAVWSDSPELAKVLVDSGAPLEKKLRQSAHTALSWAVTTGHARFASALVDLGADTDLFCSAGLGDLARVEAFWKDGNLVANPSRTGSSRFDENGQRLPRPPKDPLEQVSDALYIASRGGHGEVGKYLLSRGADPNLRGYEGGTALHWAEFSGNESLCADLRAAGASDDLIDQTFLATPFAFGMIVPAAYGMVERLRRRLDRYPESVNVRGGYGTALNAAVWNNQLACAKLLVERGADLNAKNRAGVTPLEVAYYKELPELAAYLRSVSGQ